MRLDRSWGLSIMTFASTCALACGSWGQPQVNLVSLNAKSRLEWKRMSYRYPSGRKTQTSRAQLSSEVSLPWKQATRNWRMSTFMSQSHRHHVCCGPRYCVSHFSSLISPHFMKILLSLWVWAEGFLGPRHDFQGPLEKASRQTSWRSEGHSAEFLKWLSTGNWHRSGSS